MKFITKNLLAVICVSTGSAFVFALESLQITPSEFDFGWCPENAKITAEFSVKNTSSDLIALTAVQPACGCTAANFSPSDLGSEKETRISLTFDTRGYKGVNFHKGTTIKAGTPEQEYHVVLKGTALDPRAQFIPEGNGIIHFKKEGEMRSQKLTLINKSSATISLTLIQKPASWVDMRELPSSLEAGQSIEIGVKAKGELDKEQYTSVTFKAVGDGIDQNLTVAFLTGTGPSPVRGIKPVTPPKKTVAPLEVPKP